MANLPVQTRVPPDVHTQILRAVRASGKTKAEVIRQLIEHGLSVVENIAELAEEVRRLTQEIQRMRRHAEDTDRRMDAIVPVLKSAVDGIPVQEADALWQQTRNP